MKQATTVAAAVVVTFGLCVWLGDRREIEPVHGPAVFSDRFPTWVDESRPDLGYTGVSLEARHAGSAWARLKVFCWEREPLMVEAAFDGPQEHFGNVGFGVRQRWAFETDGVTGPGPLSGDPFDEVVTGEMLAALLDAGRLIVEMDLLPVAESGVGVEQSDAGWRVEGDSVWVGLPEVWPYRATFDLGGDASSLLAVVEVCGVG